MKFVKSILKDLWSSRLSMLGAILVTVSAVLIITAWLLDVVGIKAGPYRGLIAYGLMPVVFITGLLMIPFGIWLTRRKARREGRDLVPIVIDFGNPQHRRRIVLFAFMTILNSIILSFALYEGYHYTDSVAFCGTVCHTVMQPEYTAYEHSPHARVACVDCHIGPGASWYVHSKLSGLRQVWAVLTNTYHRPIPVPVKDLRPARDTCEQCHWPQVFHGDKTSVHYSLDGEATLDNPNVTALLLKTGGFNSRTGKYVGIHWHVSNNIRVEYLPVDEKRMKIKKVRVYQPDGKMKEFVNADMPDPPAGTEWRTMDCIDCHNRPTHIFQQPDQAVDKALLAGHIDFSLPDVRAYAIKALTVKYPSVVAAKTGIETSLLDDYRSNHPDVFTQRQADIKKAAAGVFSIFTRNVFPAMDVYFNTYASNLGHDQDAGCWRCHDEEHTAADGTTIPQDCDLCHDIMAQDELLNTLSSETRKIIEQAPGDIVN